MPKALYTKYPKYNITANLAVLCAMISICSPSLASSFNFPQAHLWAGAGNLELTWADGVDNQGKWSATGATLGIGLAVETALLPATSLILRADGWLNSSTINAREAGYKITAELPYGGEAMALLSWCPGSEARLDAGVGVAGARLEVHTKDRQNRRLHSWTDTYGITYGGSLIFAASSHWSTSIDIRITRFASYSWPNGDHLQAAFMVIRGGLVYHFGP